MTVSRIVSHIACIRPTIGDTARGNTPNFCSGAKGSDSLTP
jgi:hypothetical protein